MHLFEFIQEEASLKLPQTKKRLRRPGNSVPRQTGAAIHRCFIAEGNICRRLEFRQPITDAEQLNR
jgi:hypothetical protein